MNQEALKKSVTVNLRCVTQSSKGGVPLNSLQSDYKQLIGKAIPFTELGYQSLQSFLQSIPDVVCLKQYKDGLCMVEGVADSSTAHIADLISRQKDSKSAKGSSKKPSRPIRKYYESWRSTSTNNPEGIIKQGCKGSASNSASFKVPLPKLPLNFNSDSTLSKTQRRKSIKKAILESLRKESKIPLTEFQYKNIWREIKKIEKLYKAETPSHLKVPVLEPNNTEVTSKLTPANQNNGISEKVNITKANPSIAVQTYKNTGVTSSIDNQNNVKYDQSNITKANSSLSVQKSQNSEVASSTANQNNVKSKQDIITKSNASVPVLKSKNIEVTSSTASQNNVKSESSNIAKINPLTAGNSNSIRSFSSLFMGASTSEGSAIPPTSLQIIKDNQQNSSLKISNISNEILAVGDSTMSKTQWRKARAESPANASGVLLTKTKRKNLRRKTKKAEKLCKSEISLQMLKGVHDPNILVKDTFYLDAAELQEAETQYQEYLASMRRARVGYVPNKHEKDVIDDIEHEPSTLTLDKHCSVILDTLNNKSDEYGESKIESPLCLWDKNQIQDSCDILEVPPSIQKQQLKKFTIMNLKSVTQSCKDGVLLNNLQSHYEYLFETSIPYKELGYNSLEAFIQDIPDVVYLKMNKDGQIYVKAVSNETEADIASEFFNQCAVEPIPAPVEPNTVLSSFQQREPSCSGFSNFVESNAAYKPSLNCFSNIKYSIGSANFSSLLMMNLLLFGDDSYKETLKRGILAFDGFDFCEGSDKWKEREMLFSMFPEDTLRECLKLLCLDFRSDNKQELVNKLLHFLASPGDAYSKRKL